MAVYVNDTEDEAGPVLRMVRAGDEVRPSLDPETNTVQIDGDAPEWVARIARNHGYEVEAPSDTTTADATTASEVASD